MRDSSISPRSTGVCFPLFLTLFLFACSTPYQDMGLLGGVSATQIDANTMRISARGNGFSDIGQMKDYVLLRAAEETLHHGYDLFLVTNAENVTRTETHESSFPEFHVESVNGMGVGPNGPVITHGSVSYTTYKPNSVTVTKPGEDILIRMFKGQKPADAPQNLYSAGEVAFYLGSKIRPSKDEQASELPAASAPLQTYAQSPSTASEAAAVIPACTREESDTIKWAQQNGYQIHPACKAEGSTEPNASK